MFINIPSIAFFVQSDHGMYSLVKYILLTKMKFWDLQLYIYKILKVSENFQFRNSQFWMQNSLSCQIGSLLGQTPEHSRLTAFSIVFLRSLLKSSVMRLWRATCPRSSWSFRRPCGCGAPILTQSTFIVSPSISPSTWQCVCSWVSASLKRRCTVFSALSRILWRTFLAFPSTCRLVAIGR